MEIVLQVRNGKRTAILAIQFDKAKKDSDKGKKNTKLFVVYRPNTGQQVSASSRNQNGYL